jgi:hypothetical protein
MDKQNFYSGLIEEEKRLSSIISELTVTLDAIRVLLKRYGDENYVPIQTDIFGRKITETIKPIGTKQKRVYPQRNGSTFTQKVLEALKFLGSGTAADVGKTINELYPAIELKKAQTDARLSLSRMNGGGKVIGKKMDGRNTYLYQYNK